MKREFHVRFSEGLGGQFPRATRLVAGFQRRGDAHRFKAALKERLGKFKPYYGMERPRITGVPVTFWNVRRKPAIVRSMAPAKPRTNVQEKS